MEGDHKTPTRNNPKISVTTTSKVKSDRSEISIREFLDFLKTAYQLFKLQESVEGVLLANGMTDAVDWLKLKESKMVKNESEQLQKKKSCETVSSTSSGVSSGAEGGDPVKRKLSEVIADGLLDSVLPYLASGSQQASRKSSVVKLSTSVVITEKVSQSSTHSSSHAHKRGEAPRSSVTLVPSLPKTESQIEVEIHVCDEIKSTKKDFVCNQKLLVEKMGYFAEVTAGQRLQDMDISVHCDIGIFEWLMKWVKKDTLTEEEWPQLDPQCVVPILVSAAFLQMEPLQNDCLLFCHEHLNDILRTSTNLSCLNDSILTRLAAMYTNREVETIRDKKDKIQSRVFIKLIQSLGEPEAESVRGHWSSLARIFRCAKCQQIVAPQYSKQIPCVAPCMRLQSDGSIVSHHVRDSLWNINEHIVRLHKGLKTWRRVYWHLWGEAHFLFCSICKRFFPAHQIGWCRHHPDPPQYFTVDAQKAPLPVGRYPCCGERAYRFQLLPDYSGCQFRDHSVRLSPTDVRDQAILGLLEEFREVIEEQPPQLMFPERLTRLVAREVPPGGDNNNRKLQCKETFWWEGFQIIPPRPRLGLLNSFILCSNSNKSDAVVQTVAPPPAAVEEESSEETSSTTTTSSESSTSSSEDDEEEASAEESNPPPAPSTPKKPLPRRRGRRVKRRGRFWNHNLSARSNQDIQRAHEESAMKDMMTVLSRKTALGSCDGPHCSRGSRAGYSRNVTPMGGIWVRLECEWKEQNSIPMQQKSRSIFTGGCNGPKRNSKGVLSINSNK